MMKKGLHIVCIVLVLAWIGCDATGGNNEDDPPSETPPSITIRVVTPAEPAGTSMYYPGESLTLNYEFNVIAPKGATSVLETWVENIAGTRRAEGMSGTLSFSVTEDDRALYGVAIVEGQETPVRKQIGSIRIARESEAQYVYLVRGKDASGTWRVFEIDALGEHVHELPELLPVIAENGSNVAPLGLSIGNNRAEVMVADGSTHPGCAQTPTFLNRHTGERRDMFASCSGVQKYVQAVKVSPDGTRVLYTTPEKLSANARQQVWVANVDGSNPVQITRNTCDSTPKNPDGTFTVPCRTNGVRGDWGEDGNIYVAMLGSQANSFDDRYALLRFNTQGGAQELIEVSTERQSWFVHDVIWPWLYLEGFDRTGQQTEGFTARYNVETGEYQEFPELFHLTGHPNPGWYVGFAKGGSQLFVADQNGMTRATLDVPIFPSEVTLIPPIE